MGWLSLGKQLGWLGKSDKREINQIPRLTVDISDQSERLSVSGGIRCSLFAP